MINVKRIARHLSSTQGQVKRAFPQKTLSAIEQEIKTSESGHVGEIRFAVESALSGEPLYRGLSTRERAIDVFSHLRMWDTDHRNGVLIYLLLADRSVEIVADRSIHVMAGQPEWERICRRMETAFRDRHFETGAIDGIQAVSHLLARYFPGNGAHRNELSNKVVVL